MQPGAETRGLCIGGAGGTTNKPSDVLCPRVMPEAEVSAPVVSTPLVNPPSGPLSDSATRFRGPLVCKSPGPSRPLFCEGDHREVFVSPRVLSKTEAAQQLPGPEQCLSVWVCGFRCPGLLSL